MTTLVKTTLLMKYKPIYQSTSFLTSFSLNTKSFVLNIALPSFFHSSTSFLPLSTCYFIFSCDFFNTATTSSYTFFILFANSVVFSIFPLLLIFTPILNSLCYLSFNTLPLFFFFFFFLFFLDLKYHNVFFAIMRPQYSLISVQLRAKPSRL